MVSVQNGDKHNALDVSALTWGRQNISLPPQRTMTPECQ